MGRDALRHLWPWACRLWVVAPLLGFFPDVQPRQAEWWWWNVASVIVIALGWRQHLRRRSSALWGWLLVAALAMFLLHWQEAESGAWVMQVALTISAAAMIAERGEFLWLRQAVIACAIFQIPAMLWQSHWPWPYARIGGTVGKRAPCAVLLALASLWTAWPSSFGLLWGAWLTSSWVGWPVAAGRWVVAFIRRFQAIGLMTVASLGCLAAAWVAKDIRFAWVYEVGSRVALWRSAGWGLSHWLRGWGFAPFPGGFQDSSPVGLALSWRFYHSTWLDWALRGGALGCFALALILAWICRRTRPGGSWRRWTVALAIWTASWQSLEQFPSLACLMLVWWIGLTWPTDKEGRDVRSVQGMAAA